MKIFVYCRHCYNKIILKGSFNTRWELSAERGKEFELKCPKCGQKDTYNVDDTKAQNGYISTVAFLLLFPCILVILWFLYPYFTKGIIPMFLIPIGVLIPSLTFTVILREQKRRREIFNSTRPNSLKSIKFTKKF